MTGRERTGDARRAYARAPGHITGFFRPDVAAADPRARGSVGAGLVLTPGAHARVSVAGHGPSRIRVRAGRLTSLPITEDVAARLVPRGAGEVHIEIAHDLPVGQGFSMSAAGALATALALARVFRISRQHATEVAHLAELFGGGGLGGVAALGGGGLEYRRRAGIPPYGAVVHRPFPFPVIVGVTGAPLPSPRILRDPRMVDRIDRAWETTRPGRRAPTPVEFLEGSERFTDDVGLAPSSLRRLLKEVRRSQAWAAQAMFGRSFFVVPRTARARAGVVRLLTRRRVEFRVAPVSDDGAGSSAQPF